MPFVALDEFAGPTLVLVEASVLSAALFVEISTAASAGFSVVLVGTTFDIRAFSDL